MGGLRQNTDDYDYIWQQFLDPDNEAYDIENYNKDDIYNDPNRSFFKNRNYDARQFKLSLGRLVNKLKAHLQEEQRKLMTPMIEQGNIVPLGIVLNVAHACVSAGSFRRRCPRRGC